MLLKHSHPPDSFPAGSEAGRLLRPPAVAEHSETPPAAPPGFVPFLTAVALAATGAYAVGRLQGGNPEGVVYSPNPLAALTFLLAGGAIVPRQPRNSVGWLFVAVGLATGAVAVTGAFAEASPMMWLNQWLPPLAYGLLPLALLVFPDGRLPGRRWRFALWLGIVSIALAALPLAWATWIEPRIVFDFALRAGSSASGLFAVAKAGSLLIVASCVLAAGSLIVRMRAQVGDTRRQIMVLGLGALAIPAGIGMEMLAIPGSELLVATSVPLAAGAAVLKYRLYDIDLFLNRSLVYGTLTFVLALVYAALAALAGGLLGERSSAIIATGAVAVLFQPLRAGVQRGVSRLLYGERDDPYAAVSRLSKILEPAMEPEILLDRLTEAIADALRLPFAAVETIDGEGNSVAVATRGRRLSAVEEFRMTHDGRLVGRILVSPRTANGSFTHSERSLLTNLARQAGVAVHALQLTADLRASRARLVRSREEERLRLRRDLHDGIGPALAGATMQIGAVRTAGSEGRDAVLDRLEQILQSCLAEIRLIVDGLRPESLDALGLAHAVRKTAAMFAGATGGLKIEVVSLPDVLRVPAAVEVAAYRIATEAITNVVRHSGAGQCRVTLRLNGDLVVEVADDGRGLPDGFIAGVGLTSMRERAEELGGLLTVRTGGEGTTLTATLPLAS